MGCLFEARPAGVSITASTLMRVFLAKNSRILSPDHRQEDLVQEDLVRVVRVPEVRLEHHHQGKKILIKTKKISFKKTRKIILKGKRILKKIKRIITSKNKKTPNFFLLRG